MGKKYYYNKKKFHKNNDNRNLEEKNAEVADADEQIDEEQATEECNAEGQKAVNQKTFNQKADSQRHGHHKSDNQRDNIKNDKNNSSDCASNCGSNCSNSCASGCELCSKTCANAASCQLTSEVSATAGINNEADDVLMTENEADDMSESTEPVKVIGVRFRQAGKVYYFDPLDMNIKKNDGVIVETVRGIEFGNVVLGVCEVPGNKVVQPLRPVIRIATEEDTEKEFTNREKEIEALMTCREKVASHDLQMKLVGAEYTFDNSQLLFYFTADGRVDFRDLVKDLAATFKTRIELRQIGPRDETKIIGGIGMCGRPLCCNTYLSDFTNVTIKMAKDQGIALNPQKISGVCNRLMCCLKYEQEVYEELNAKLPNKGDKVQTNDGFVGVVESTNAIRQLVKVVVVTDDSKGDEPTKEIRDYAVSDLKFEPRKKKKPQNQKQENSTEEKSLKSLED